MGGEPADGLRAWAAAHAATLRIAPGAPAPARSPVDVLGGPGAIPFRTGTAPAGNLVPADPGDIHVPAEPEHMLVGHTEHILAAAWAADRDGRLLLATGSLDGTARIWDPDTGQTLTTLTGHTNPVWSVAWAADRDGRLLLATGSADGTARIWDPDTGQTLTTLTGHTSSVWSVAWAADRDGRLLLATGSADGTARIWDPDTGQTLTTLTGHTNTVWSVAWAADRDGRLLLATGNADNTARIWDPDTGQTLTTLTGHTNLIRSVAWAADRDGRLLLATGSLDQTARIWDPDTGQTLTTLTGHTNLIRSVAWFTDHERRLLLATGSIDHTVRIWDPATGQQGATLDHPDEVSAVAFAPADAGTGELLLATGCSDGRARMYRIRLGAPPSATRGTPRPRLRESAVLRPRPELAGPKPVAGALDPIGPGEVRAQAAPTVTLARHSQRVWSAAWAADDDGRLLLATGSADHTARIWDPATGQTLTTLTGHTDIIYSVAWAADRDDRLLLATASADHTARIWDPATGQHLTTLTGHTNYVRSVAWAADRDGRLLLATASSDGTARIWDPATGQHLTTLTGHTNYVWSVAWAADRDGRLLLATGGDDGTTWIWDPATGQHLTTLTGHTNYVFSVAWAADRDGRLLLATSSGDYTARIWDPATGQHLTTLTGHGNRMFEVAWATTGDGRLLLVTGGADGTARIWDPGTGQQLAALDHPDEVNAVAFTPGDAGTGGLLLVTGCDDFQARVYRIETPYRAGDLAGEVEGTEDTGNGLTSDAGYVSPPTVLSAAVSGLLALGERNLYIPLGLLADLLVLTAVSPGPEVSGRLNNPALAALDVHPTVVGLRALGWPTSARTGLAALLSAGSPFPLLYSPPAGTSPETLEASLRDALDHPRPGAPAGLTGAAGALPANTIALLDILGPNAVAADPTLPLRLLHAAARLPSLTLGQLMFLTAHQPPSRVSDRPAARVPIPDEGFPAASSPALTHRGRPHRLVHTHLALPRPVFTAHLAATALLYRHHVQPPARQHEPVTLVLDTTPPTYGPIETTLRLIAHLITVTLWATGTYPTLITTTHPHTPQPLTKPAHLVHLWTTRTLRPPDLRTPLNAATSLNQPVFVLTHHHTAASQHVHPAAGIIHSLITTHTPDTPAPPSPAHSHHHHIPPNPTDAQLTALVNTLMTSDT